LVALRNVAARLRAPLSADRASCEDDLRGPTPVPTRTRMRREDPRTDAQVAVAVLAGDTEAFSVLVDRHQRRVFNLVLRMVANRSDAEDLSQEIFCKLYQQLDRYDPSLPLENWLVRIATNHTINWLERKRVPTVPLEIQARGPHALLEPRDREPLPIDRAEDSEARAMILGALQQLPTNLRLVFVLKYMEDYTSEEVAALIDVPRNTAKTWIFRAREALRAEIERLMAGRSDATRRERR
jgi:RNA polymerase sigma-70 factor, ECF subfamily